MQNDIAVTASITMPPTPAGPSSLAAAGDVITVVAAVVEARIVLMPQPSSLQGALAMTGILDSGDTLNAVSCVAEMT